MKRLLCVILAALMLAGCGASAGSEGDSFSDKIKALESIIPEEVAALYISPEYSVFSKPASENGMANTLVTLQGTVGKIIHETEVMNADFSTEESEAWLISWPANIDAGTEPAFAEGDSIIAFGTYQGVSGNHEDKPAIILTRYAHDGKLRSPRLEGFELSAIFEGFVKSDAIADTSDIQIDITMLRFTNPLYDANISTDFPTPDDLLRYDEVLERLNDFSRSEQEILEEIAPEYQMNAEELKNYLTEIMPYATGLKSTGAYVPSMNDVKNCFRVAIDSMLKDYILNDYILDISGTGTKYIATTPRLEIDGASHELIIKIEFSSDYSTFEVFQVKLDGRDIDL